MPSPKPLPSNLKQLEQQAKFKQFYKQHTAEQLEEKLIEAGIEYGQDETKAALTWRVMDANSVSFDLQAQTETTSHANNDVPTAPTPQADDSKAGNNTDDSVKTESGDHVETNPSVSVNGDSVSTNDGGAKEQPNADTNKPADDTKTDTKPQANKPAPQKPVKAEREHVEVTNNGSFAFFETATATLVRAKETVKVYTTPTIDKAHIMRNVDQYNYTRGNKLSVSE